MRLQRRKIVERLREEGRQAFLDGRHIQTCPYRYMDMYQWQQGYYDAAAAEQDRKPSTEDFEMSDRAKTEIEQLTAERDQLRKDALSWASQVVSGFYEDEIPIFRQGAPVHELEESVTAAECRGWVARIQALTRVALTAQALMRKRGDVEWPDEGQLRELSLALKAAGYSGD